MQKETSKFANVPLQYIEKWLCEMEEHANRKHQQFTKTYQPFSEPIIYSSQTTNGNNISTKSLHGQIRGL